MKKLILGVALCVATMGFSQKTMPSMKLKSLQGKTFSLTDGFNEKDRFYIFSFWATWCVPCIEELESFNELKEDWASKLNYQIVPVSIDDSRGARRIKPLVNGKGWEYDPILLDSNQALKRKLGIANPPYLVIVKNGEVIKTLSGMEPGGAERLLQELSEMK
ncbi:MAG: thiol:disulfide interchange protein [Flavobacteriales bacterium]|nr:MAG: thiol:disulfide interchange protein [Flavobacteriales bacterium]